MAEILITGANGFLGGHFLRHFDDASASTVDIANEPDVIRELESKQPAIVINCAGKTGRPNVDWCEDNKAETLRGNVTGPLVLMNHCLARNIYLVHLSTGCLYTGDADGRGFSEDDPPNFSGSYYVRTKAHAEQLLKEFPVLMLRPRMPFDSSTNPRNLIMKLCRYDRVIDQPNSMTCIPDLLRAARMLIERREIGIFNVVNPGVLSPFEIMQAYQRDVDPGHEVTRLSLAELGHIAVAPRSNCVLSTDKLAASGIELPPASVAMRDALAALPVPLRGPATS